MLRKSRGFSVFLCLNFMLYNTCIMEVASNKFIKDEFHRKRFRRIGAGVQQTRYRFFPSKFKNITPFFEEKEFSTSSNFSKDFHDTGVLVDIFDAGKKRKVEKHNDAKGKLVFKPAINSLKSSTQPKSEQYYKVEGSIPNDVRMVHFLQYISPHKETNGKSNDDSETTKLSLNQTRDDGSQRSVSSSEFDATNLLTNSVKQWPFLYSQEDSNLSSDNSKGGGTLRAQEDVENIVKVRSKRSSSALEPDAATVSSENSTNVPEPNAETEPEGESIPSTETEPEGEGEPSAETEPEGEGEPSTETEPEGEGEPSAETEPEGEGEPSAETEPEGEGEPSTETEPEGEGEPSAETEPEGEGEPSAETEPEGESVPIAEAEAGSEPLSESEPEAESGQGSGASAEAEVWPEPGPEWSVAIDKWLQAWPFHVIFSALLFILVSLAACLIIVLTVQEKGWKRCSKSVIALTSLILSFSLTRTIFLCADAYGYTSNLPFLLQRMLFSVGLPGILAAFSNLLFIILDTTKSTTGPPRFLKLNFILGLYAVHMVAVIISDCLVILVEGWAKFILLLCQLFFVLYGFTSAAGFFYAGMVLRRNLAASKNSIDPLQSRLKVLQRLSYGSGGVAGCLGVVYLYMTVGDMGIFSENDHVEAWEWWTVQTITRLLEALACVMVLLAFMNTAKASTLRDILHKWWLNVTCVNQVATVNDTGATRAVETSITKRDTTSTVSEAFQTYTL